MAKFYNFKNKRFYIGFSRIGNKAYSISKYWKLGFHLFKTSNNELIFRIVYFRNKKHTYYWEIDIENKIYWENYA